MAEKDTVVHQDYSKLSQLLSPWWNFVANSLPNTISPNMITFTGGLFMLLSGILSTISNSSWTLLFHSLCIFMFQTLDAVDGIHARKLGLSSKLGNYIDHATDIFTVQIMFQVLFNILNLNRTYLILATIFVNFNLYLIHWETAHTNILYFENGFSITELQWITIAIHLVTFSVPNIWKIYIIYFSLNNIFIILLISLNFYFLTMPLIDRVIEKKTINILRSLRSLFVITFILIAWGFETNIDNIYLIICINIPYTLMVDKLLLSYLKLEKNAKIELDSRIELDSGIELGIMRLEQVYLFISLIILIEFVDTFSSIIIKCISFILLYIAIKGYYKNIQKISNNLNISILKIDKKNIKKDS